jgi:arylsulfatase
VPNPTAGTLPGTTQPGRPPNIVYIYFDQMRGDAIGPANPFASTPHLDAFAAEAVHFALCYTNGPVCRPARGVQLTGHYPHQTGVIHNTTLPDPTQPNHVRRLRDEAGYDTMLIGKFHLYDSDLHTADCKDRMAFFGYTDSLELLGQTDSTVRESAYSDFLTANTPSGEEDKYQRYIDYTANYTWDSPPPDSDPWGLTTADHLDQYCASEAASWIRARRNGNPFYLQLNFPGPHKPFNGTSEFRARFESVELPGAILVTPENPGPLTKQYLGLKFEAWNPETQRNLALQYYATVALVDDALGQVLDALRETGRMDDTWIVIGGDHGELLGDHMMTGKVVFYEGAIHQPLLIRPPGGCAPWQTVALVDQVDVTATVLDLAGLGVLDTQPGSSLLGKVLAGPSAPDAQFHKRDVFGGNIGYYFLRDQRFKACYDPESVEIVELYDLTTDPLELDNRARDAELAAEREDLLLRLESYLKRWPEVAEANVAPYLDAGETT